MSHPQPKLPTSDELIEKYSVAGGKFYRDSGTLLGERLRAEGLRQVKKYR